MTHAARHGLSGFVRQGLGAAGVALPAKEAEALRRAALSLMLTAERSRTLLLQSLDALAVEGVTPLLLKGPGLAARYWPDPTSRPMTDVDLLVLRVELPPSERAMAKLGLQPMDDPEVAYRREHHHHVNFYGEGRAVELHFRAITGFGVAMESEDLFARAVHASFEGRKVRYLSAEDELLYLCVHAAQHLFLRLSWLVDVALLLRAHPGLDLHAVAARARQGHLHGPLFAALSATRVATGVGVDEQWLSQLCPARTYRALVQTFFSAERLEAGDLDAQKWRSYAVQTLLASDTQRRASFAWHHLGRGLRRKVVAALPGVAPEAWRG